MPRSPLSMRMEGPRTPGEVAVEKKWREKQNKPEQKETPEGFEKVLTLSDVKAYFEDMNFPGREDLCHYPFKCNIGRVERALLDDMGTTKHPDEINYIRKILRAASWMSYERPKKQDLVTKARLLQEEFVRHRAEIARTDEREAKEWDEEVDMTDHILEALTRDMRGEAAEPAVRGIETLFARKRHEYETAGRVAGGKRDKLVERLKGEVEALRPLRDWLYFQRLYPNWAEAGSPTSRSARPGSKSRTRTGS